MATYFETPRYDEHPPLTPEIKDSEHEKYLAWLEGVREFLVEKHIDDPENAPGFIYDLPREYIQPGTPDYSKYMCRGNVAGDLVMRTYWFTDPRFSPLEKQSREQIKFYLNEIDQIYKQRGDGGVKTMRTPEEMQMVKGLINLIVVEIEDGLNIDNNQRTGRKLGAAATA